MRQRPVILGAIFGAGLLVTLNILREVRHGDAGRAFVSSSLAIVTHLLLFAAAVFPVLVFSTPDHSNDMTIFNSAATDKTLQFMFVVALIGIPLVLTYTITIYYVFRGKVRVGEGYH